MYLVEDECDFIAWIASNGVLDRNGRLKSDKEVEEDGKPKIRSGIARIDFLRNYSDGWQKRKLPSGWKEIHRRMVSSYIRDIAIPSVIQMREVILGDLV
jgi:hypothetical protein